MRARRGAGERRRRERSRRAVAAAVGKVAACMSSDQAGPMTATFANITCGAVLD